MAHETASKADAPTINPFSELGERIVALLTDVRVHAVSLHDDEGEVLWLNDGWIGPDEHGAMRDAMEQLASPSVAGPIEQRIGDGRCALVLRAPDARGGLAGVCMLVADQRFLPRLKELASGASARDFEREMQAFSRLLIARAAPKSAAAPASTPTPIELVATVTAVPNAAAARVSTPVSAAATAPAAVPAASAGPAAVAVPAPAPVVAPAATPRAAPARRIIEGPDVDPILDRHFAALRSVPIALHVQRLQPLLPGSRIRRYEVLLRTATEGSPDVAPVAMIEAAEKHGLGSVIDRRVLTELVTWLKKHPQAWKKEPLLLTVNLSVTSIHDDHFLRFVELCLAKADLPKGVIAFEIPEAVCNQHPERAAIVSQALAALGCSIVIDDFGWRSHAIDELRLKGAKMLKLDPELTANVAGDRVKQAVVAGITRMARVTGLHTVAKRVDVKHQRRTLATLGIDFAQGFAFATPLPIDSILKEPLKP